MDFLPTLVSPAASLAPETEGRTQCTAKHGTQPVLGSKAMGDPQHQRQWVMRGPGNLQLRVGTDGNMLKCKMLFAEGSRYSL